MKFGTLDFTPAKEAPELLASPVQEAVSDLSAEQLLVTAIDASLSDTAAFCEHYQIGMEKAANCVIVEAKRADKTWYAACMIRGTDRADINGVIRKFLGARKLSFAPIETATSLTGMEFGGITPLGLPQEWPVLVDTAVAATDFVIIGSGIRSSKLLVPGTLLATLPTAMVLELAKK